MLRIVAISDTHGRHLDFPVPEGDILLHAGDIGTSGWGDREAASFAQWLSTTPHRMRFVTCGNHDRFALHHAGGIENFKKTISRESGGTSELLIGRESCKYGNLSVFGAPWTPTRSSKHRTGVAVTSRLPFGTVSKVAAWLGCHVAFTLPRDGREIREK